MRHIPMQIIRCRYYLTTLLILFLQFQAMASEDKLKNEIAQRILKSEITQFFKANTHPAPLSAILEIANAADIRLNDTQTNNIKHCIEQIQTDSSAFDQSLLYALTKIYSVEKLKSMESELQQKSIFDLIKHKYAAIQSGIDYLAYTTDSLQKRLQHRDLRWLKTFYAEPIPQIYYKFEMNEFNQSMVVRLKPSATCLLKELSPEMKKRFGKFADQQVNITQLHKTKSKKLEADLYLVAMADAIKGMSEQKFKDEIKTIYNKKSQIIYFLATVRISQEQVLRTDVSLAK